MFFLRTLLGMTTEDRSPLPTHPDRTGCRLAGRQCTRQGPAPSWPAPSRGSGVTLRAATWGQQRAEQPLQGAWSLVPVRCHGNRQSPLSPGRAPPDQRARHTRRSLSLSLSLSHRHARGLACPKGALLRSALASLWVADPGHPGECLRTGQGDPSPPATGGEMDQGPGWPGGQLLVTGMCV